MQKKTKVLTSLNSDLSEVNDTVSNITNRITTLEGNFNTALTSLYNACVEKDSTPSSRTISAIVTAVQNISVGSEDLKKFDDYQLALSDIMINTDPMSVLIYENVSSDTKILTGSNTLYKTSTPFVLIDSVHNGKKVVLN